MVKHFKIVSVVFFVILFVTCNNKESKQANQDTFLKGKTTMLVDETLKPIVEDEVQVFESQYEAKITIKAKSEAEIIQTMVKDSSSIAILSRTLSDKEIKIFQNKKITPRITPFAIDAIAFITNINNKDTLIALQEVVDFLKGTKNTKIKGLVFDNPNSSTVAYFKKITGLAELQAEGVFSFETNEEVVKYVAENNGMIGIVGINHIFEPSVSMQEYLPRINVLHLKNTKDNLYYSPTQDNIASGNYPLARELYIVNCEGHSGLGMGFTSFVIGDVGQRIILKSGLVPKKIPPRKILIRDQINNDKK